MTTIEAIAILLTLSLLIHPYLAAWVLIALVLTWVVGSVLRWADLGGEK